MSNTQDTFARNYANSLIKVAIQASNRARGAYSPKFVEWYLEASIVDLLDDLQLTKKQIEVLERNLNSRQCHEELV